MLKTIKVEKEVNIVEIHASVDVRYWEDAKLNGKELDESGEGFPFKNGSNWEPKIMIDSGQVINWPIGSTADIHFKVCDAGIYKLIDDKGNIVSTKDGYVPNIMCPNGEGYGDYIIMTINKDGLIDNWRNDVDDFFEEDED